MAEVRLAQVKKRYGDVVAVRDVSLTIQDKEFVVLVGPSGCGKSTTLRMIAGLEEITEGEIFIGDRLVNDVAPKDRDIAMVFQSYALYPHMTVFENMAFGLRLQRIPQAQINDRVNEAANILGLQDLLKRRPGALSGGQRQRVAMGRAIVRRPAVFLFDEPLSNLDAKLRVQMRTEIARLHHQLESTSVYVTHDQVEAMTLADRIVVMNEGRIQQVGSPMELYNEPANQFVASFIGSPSMNLIPCDVVQKDGKVTLQNEGLNLTLSEAWSAKLKDSKQTKWMLGVRPQHLSLVEDSNSTGFTHAVLEVQEPLGAETFMYLRCGSEQIVLREESEEVHEIGASYQLKIDLDHIHLFDHETGLALG
ncbi:MAG: sn-glycerol-3-phosphate ABC transporter ATP-binding protein UgpC [Deltaproteobacteria bacterium]|nr:MAG: sn-glycerol-3-phosphate ABC transporter ATP-binding protein UgpC [Deltaproteobacteria bacterium]